VHSEGKDVSREARKGDSYLEDQHLLLRIHDKLPWQCLTLTGVFLSDELGEACSSASESHLLVKNSYGFESLSDLPENRRNFNYVRAILSRLVERVGDIGDVRYHA